MRFLHILAMVVMSAAPALAQSTPVPKYGEVDKAKTPSEIESERAAESAYRRSLGNVPNAAGATDPWGSVRNDGVTKPATKTSPVKRTKSSETAK